MTSEEDTFNKLRRKPIIDVIEYWYDRRHGEDMLCAEYVRRSNYSLLEFLDAWYDHFDIINIDGRNRELWIAETSLEIISIDT